MKTIRATVWLSALWWWWWWWCGYIALFVRLSVTGIVVVAVAVVIATVILRARTQ